MGVDLLEAIESVVLSAHGFVGLTEIVKGIQFLLVHGKHFLQRLLVLFHCHIELVFCLEAASEINDGIQAFLRLTLSKLERKLNLA